MEDLPAAAGDADAAADAADDSAASRGSGRRRRVAMIGLLVVALAALAGQRLWLFLTGEQSRPAVAKLTGPGRDAAAAWTDVPTGEVAVRDYAQFQGPDRDATIPDVELDPDWTANPPLELWRRPIGPGWSGFVVAGERAVTQEQDGESELVTCYGLRTGEELWRHAEAARHSDSAGGPGPRATPSVADGCVYALGATGVLVCVELETGALLWRRDVLADAKAETKRWGLSGSPLLTPEGHVVVSAGGGDGWSLVAYRASDGEVAWHAGDDEAGYGSPALRTIGGRAAIVVFNEGRVVAHDPSDGAILWTVPWHKKSLGGMVTPLVLEGDRLLMVTAYGGGAKLFQLAGDPLESAELWHSTRLQTKYTSLVTRDGVVFGTSSGFLSAVRLDDGESLWRGDRFGDAHLLAVSDLVLLHGGKGTLALLRLDATGATELGRLDALPGRSGAPPAFAAPFLVLRNDREAVCYRLPLR